jgi:alkanesulfonate monooxygenase SsuD/methylene tetrahydromethanopterin reductase-like flavin-dependent oxidoreductase (luciferase family)
LEIAIGLPNAVPGVDGKSLTEFARRADQRGFSSLGTIDRLVFSNYEPLAALGAAAAVTERIRLATTILITPYRPNAALLAKEVATLDHMSGGRFVFGVGIGGREDDYTASGLTMKGRGKIIDHQLEEMRKIWDGEERGFAGAIGPQPIGGPELLVGGGADAAFERAAKYGDGWIMGAGTADVFAEASPKVDAAWQRAGRDGRPRKAALAYFSLGPDADANTAASIKDYYGWLGEYVQMITDAVANTPEKAQGYVKAFADAGCDELFLFPASKDPDQVDLLADAVKPAG